MKFEIDFNDPNKYEDNFLINVLGAKVTSTDSDKYPPFDVLKLEVRDFEHLRDILNIVDAHYDGFYSAIISYDPPTIYLDNNI